MSDDYVPSDGLERSAWESTPDWLFWKPKWRRKVYAFFGEAIRWEYTDVPTHKTHYLS